MSRLAGRRGPSDAADQALTSHHGVPPPEAAHLRNFSGPGSCEQTCIACSTVPRRARTARCPRGKHQFECSHTRALWDRSQSRAAVVVLPHSVPCSADVLSRRCDIIAQATCEGSPVTRRHAARSCSSCSCRIKTHFGASRDALHPNFRPGYTRPTPPYFAGLAFRRAQGFWRRRGPPRRVWEGFFAL